MPAVDAHTCHFLLPAIFSHHPFDTTTHVLLSPMCSSHPFAPISHWLQAAIGSLTSATEDLTQSSVLQTVDE